MILLVMRTSVAKFHSSHLVRNAELPADNIVHNLRSVRVV